MTELGPLLDLLSKGSITVLLGAVVWYLKARTEKPDATIASLNKALLDLSEARRGDAEKYATALGDLGKPLVVLAAQLGERLRNLDEISGAPRG